MGVRVSPALWVPRLLPALAVLLVGYAAVGGPAETGVLAGALGAVLVAWALVGTAAVVRVVVPPGPGPVPPARWAAAHAEVPRQRDPDAPGRVRARAPSTGRPPA